jgi:serine/threonine-protein kinase HipA
MRALEVRLGSTRVGLLEHTDEWEYRFSFDASYLRASEERLVLGQLFEDRKPYEIATTGHVPIWFSHLLPQARLRRAIAQRLGVDVDDEFDLLEFLGEDLPGAVVLLPSQPRLSREPPPPRISAPPLAQKLRVALAGMQWKLSVRPGERGWTVPVQGETGSFIAKFHDPTFKDMPRVELATMRWAELVGISLPAFRQARVTEFAELPEAIPTGDGTVFLIQRFDRNPAGGRIHMEDLAQVLDRPPGDPQYGGRYEHLAAFLSWEAPEDVRPFCERLVFCILCGNTDAHLKNWSILYPDGRHPRLSPAYDLVASVLYAPQDITDDLALSLGESRRFEDMRLDSFRLLAKASGYSFDEVASWVRLMVQRVRAIWRQEAGHLPLLDSERKRIEDHMARVPLAWEG